MSNVVCIIHSSLLSHVFLVTAPLIKKKKEEVEGKKNLFQIKNRLDFGDVKWAEGGGRHADCRRP